VYLLPDKAPLHPVTDEMPYPELGVTVNDMVDPLLALDDVGLMLPPADGVAVVVTV